MRCHKALLPCVRRAQQAIQSSIVIGRMFRALSYAPREAAAAMKCRYLGKFAHRQRSHDERM